MRTIDESSTVLLSWDVFNFLLINAGSILIPFQLFFHHEALTFGSAIINLIDFFFGVDILLNFFTSFSQEGEDRSRCTSDGSLQTEDLLLYRPYRKPSTGCLIPLTR